MSENIAGYADKTYVKGQYYKYAASPKPVTFTGDIDEVSDDLFKYDALIFNNELQEE